jgi:selenide,water dikinase
MNSENVVVLGGHSVDDQEIKFGYSVTGIINPDRVITNSGAKPGDALFLTKPIGTGAINTAVKNAKARPETVTAALETMKQSSREASKTMQDLRAHACTDITGFGLIGHAFEMAKASNVTFQLESSQVPLLPDVLELIATGMLTRGDKNNRVYVGDTVRIAESVTGVMQSALFDPQTAGGLLISIESARGDEFLSRVPNAKCIGHVVEKRDHLIEVS